MVPLSFHVDGVKIWKSSGQNTEALVYSISGHLIRATSFKSKFPLCMVPVHLCNRDTNAFVVFYIRYLLQVLRTGCEPRIGYSGKVLNPAPGELRRCFPDGHFGLFAALKTDLKEKVNQHGCTVIMFIIMKWLLAYSCGFHWLSHCGPCALEAPPFPA